MEQIFREAGKEYEVAKASGELDKKEKYDALIKRSSEYCPQV